MEMLNVTFKGHLDLVRRGWVEGWAWDSNHPSDCLTTIVSLNGKEVARGIANIIRPDLADAHMNEGRCAFSIRWDDTDMPVGNHQVSVTIEGEEFELSGSPAPYIIAGGSNLLDEISYCLDTMKRPLFCQLTTLELGCIAFEASGNDDPFLRIWLLHPPAVPRDEIASDGSAPETTLLRYAVGRRSTFQGERVMVGLDIRAMSLGIPISIRIRGATGGKTIIDRQYSAVVGNAWETLLFEVNARQSGSDDLAGVNVSKNAAILHTVEDWTLELLTGSSSVMAGVEVRNFVLGTPRPNIALVPNTLQAVDFYETPQGGMTETNLLTSISMLSPALDGQPSLAEKWSTVRGRNGELTISVYVHQWLPNDDQRYQPRRLARFEITKNSYYFRFIHQLRGSAIACNKRLAAELMFGAAIPAGTTSGLALQSFLRVLKADDTEIILPLIPRQEVTAAFILRSEVLVLDDEKVGTLQACRSVQYVVEITGTGSLLIGPCWLGDADLPAAKVERVSAAVDLAAREWHYQRYIETVETQFVRSGTRMEVIACVTAPAGRPSMLRNQTITATVRSLIKHVSKILICLNAAGGDADSDAATLQHDLGRVISLLEMTKIEVRSILEDSEAVAFFAELVDRSSPKTFLIALPAGSIVRADFSQALGSLSVDQPEAAFVVFDHDMLTPQGRRTAPALKPGLSSHLLLETDYIGPAVVFRVDAMQQVLRDGAISPVLPFGTRDVALRLFEANVVGVKLDQILLHLPVGLQQHSLASERSFIEGVVARGTVPATVSRWGSEYTVRYQPQGQPLVSIIVPFRDKVEYLQVCVDSIIKRSLYKNYEIILINNRSKHPETLEYLASLAGNPSIKVIDFDRPFNYSVANNLGARIAKGDYLLFLNNDTEVLTPEWLDVMIGLAGLKDSGFVGARLHFEDGTIQHAGIVVGLKGMANHVFSGQHDVAMPPTVTLHTRDVSAVTGAAMCIKTERYHALGGYDERFVLTGNDVDVCLRARHMGLRNIYAGSVQLFHFEKTSRNQIPVYLRDIQLSLETYEPELSLGDPYWNTILSRLRTDYLPRAPVEPTAADERQAATEKRLREMRARKLGPDTGFIAAYDIDQVTMDANRRGNEAYARGETGAVRRAAFFVPPVSHVYRGGLFTCFRFAAALYRQEGIQPLVVICSEQIPNFEMLYTQFGEAFPGVPFQIHHFNPVRQSPINIPQADIAIATLWITAYIIARYPAHGKFYLIQDYEPLFESGGAGYGLIEASYRFGFFPICNSPGVASAIAPYGQIPTFVFEPAVDQTAFFPRIAPRPTDAPIRIVFYGRPNNPRNLFGLGIHALLELKSILGDSVEILSAGAVFDPKDHGAAGKINNLGLLPGIESVAALYRSSDIGLVFMQSKHPSYQPLEYMASGCATVTNRNEANTWLLRHRQNCLLTQVALTDVVDSLVELVYDNALRDAIRAQGLTTIRALDWSVIEAGVTNFVMRPASVPVLNQSLLSLKAVQ